MSNEVFEEIFDDISRRKAEARKRARDRIEEQRKREKPKMPVKKKTVGIFDLFRNGIRAARDAITGPKEEEKVVVDSRGSTPVQGHDVTYTVPIDASVLEVQILEPNGRLKNKYTLTNYLAIKPGDKFRLIAK